MIIHILSGYTCFFIIKKYKTQLDVHHYLWESDVVFLPIFFIKL